MNDSYCDSKAPSIYEPCNRHECPQWRVGEWGACTKSCFNSTRSRLVYCMNMSSHVESNQCRQTPKPSDIETCVNNQECPVWTSNEWSNCSASCGKGVQTREVRCVIEKKTQKEEVDKSKCDPLLEPSRTVECFSSRVCPEWRVTQWTSCSVSCGKGYRMRYVYCSERGSIECSSKTRPSNSEVCIMPNCSNKWKVGEWSEVVKLFVLFLI